MKILITGASGLLGCYLLRDAHGHFEDVFGWRGSRQGTFFKTPVKPVDLTDPEQVARGLDEANPDLILHTAALARVPDCQKDPQRAVQVNVHGTTVLAEHAARRGARFVLVSTDLVFDGEQAPYQETHEAHPLSTYGRTKREAEKVVLVYPDFAVVRVSLLIGPSLNGIPSFFDRQIAALQTGQPLPLFADEWRTPLALNSAAAALLAIGQSPVTGLLHLGGPERMSRLEMGLRLAATLGVSSRAILPTQRPTTGEPRPRDVSLDSSLWRRLFPDSPWPAWDEAMAGMLLARRNH